MLIAEHHTMLAASASPPKRDEPRYETITDKRLLAELKITAPAATSSSAHPTAARRRVHLGSVDRCGRSLAPRRARSNVPPMGNAHSLDVPPESRHARDPAVPLLSRRVKKDNAGGVLAGRRRPSGALALAVAKWGRGGRSRSLRINQRPPRDHRVRQRHGPQQTGAGRGPRLAGYLATKGARIEWLWLPDTDGRPVSTTTSSSIPSRS